MASQRRPRTVLQVDDTALLARCTQSLQKLLWSVEEGICEVQLALESRQVRSIVGRRPRFRCGEGPRRECGDLACRLNLIANTMSEESQRIPVRLGVCRRLDLIKLSGAVTSSKLAYGLWAARRVSLVRLCAHHNNFRG